jgi:hypothetical protein
MCDCDAPQASACSSDAAIRETVSKYYGEELKTSEDLKTSACKACIAPPKEIRDLLREVGTGCCMGVRGRACATSAASLRLRTHPLNCS